VVRTRGGATAEVRKSLEARGIQVLGYLPDDALLVSAEARSVGSFEGVSGVESWSAEQGIVPEVFRLGIDDASLFPAGVPMVVGFAPGTDVAAAADRLARIGADVSWISESSEVPQIGVLVPPANLAAVRDSLRTFDRLVWADLQPPIRLRNSESVWRCQTGEVDDTVVFDHGLRGDRQIIGILDSGIDIDHCQFRDDEYGLPALNDHEGTSISVHRKVIAVDFYWENDWPDPGPGSWDDEGHGSHVAGSAAGDEGADGSHQFVDGMAPAARLVIQDGGAAIDDCGDMPGIGCPMRPLEPVLQQAFSQGARLHTNSWGDEEEIPPFNRYTERTADVDRFIWNHRNFLVFFAGGNDGPSDNSIGSPATGKNVVAVGATRRGNVEPPCVTSFSSRGWTHDGRIKPDIVAPGESVVSAFSDGSIDTRNCDVTTKGGTSMATPTVAGLAALVRQYYVDGYYPGGTPTATRGFIPSAALIKASLIASAVDLTTLGCLNTQPIPSRDQGWGLVQLDRVLHFPGADFRLFVDDHRMGFNGSDDEAVTYRVRVPTGGALKVVLVWTDPPSNSAAAVNLVNDLDLEVVGPDGRYLANDFVWGISVQGDQHDRLNNVEVVSLLEASQGVWTITVTPYRIAEAGQDFALVVTGAISVDRSGPRRTTGRVVTRD
jgi:hypothetical protein